MCVEVNVIYSLIAFAIIFFCDIFLVLKFWTCGECRKMFSSAQGGIFQKNISRTQHFVPLDGTNNLW